LCKLGAWVFGIGMACSDLGLWIGSFVGWMDGRECGLRSKVEMRMFMTRLVNCGWVSIEQTYSAAVQLSGECLPGKMVNGERWLTQKNGQCGFLIITF
jgi:hypothetical protein